MKHLSDFESLPMALSHVEIDALVAALLALGPPSVASLRVLGGLHDRQQLLWRPFEGVTRHAIDGWLAAGWCETFDFVDAAATWVVSLDLPQSRGRLAVTAASAEAAVAELARAALDEG